MILLELFWTFFRIGAFTFGGGYAMLPLIQAGVQSNGWMSMEKLINFVAVSESTPGPFAVNIATYVGTNTAGILGGICATLGVVLPSFIVILIVARCYERFKASGVVQGCMSGLKPAVVGMIASALLSVGQTVFFPNGMSAGVFGNAEFLGSAAIFVLMAVLAFRKTHPILIVCLSAVLGVVLGYAFAIQC